MTKMCVADIKSVIFAGFDLIQYPDFGTQTTHLLRRLWEMS